MYRRNLISISLLDELGFSFTFTFGRSKISMTLNSQVIGYGILVDGLYKLSLNNVAKRSKVEEKSFSLWHKRLGHISRERVERLTKANILPSLDVDDLGTCVDCIRGKFTKTNRKGATRSSELLEIIHIDISGPLTPTICGNKLFITFIDDFS